MHSTLASEERERLEEQRGSPHDDSYANINVHIMYTEMMEGWGEKEAIGGTEIFVSHESGLGRKGRNCVGGEDTSAHQQPEQLQDLADWNELNLTKYVQTKVHKTGFQHLKSHIQS